MEDTRIYYEEELNSIKEKITAYDKAKGTQDSKEISSIVQDVNKTLESKLNNKLANVIDTNKDVDQVLIDQDV